MLRRLFNSLRKTKVGSDRLGNQYFVGPLDDPPRTLRRDHVPITERRWVEYKEEIPDPNVIPDLWRHWLSYQRQDPPSPIDMEKDAQKKAAFQQRVKELEEEDEKLRIQQFAEGGPVNTTGAPDLQSLMSSIANNQQKEDEKDRS